MFGFLKKRLLVADVDGIKFYTYKAFRRYLDEREVRLANRRSRLGKNCYTFDIPWYQATTTVPDAKVILERNGVFDYEVYDNGDYVTVKYWSNSLILEWKGV